MEFVIIKILLIFKAYYDVYLRVINSQLEVKL